MCLTDGAIFLEKPICVGYLALSLALLLLVMLLPAKRKGRDVAFREA